MPTMENKELKSNEYYSLSQLFSTPNRKIIIPDFQRDYCWGDETHGEKHDTDIVSSFVDTLTEEFNNNQNTDVLLGKIDVYEHPKNYIYLTDGQQRLTTLYLLLGTLYRNEQNAEQKGKIKSCLISDFEENNDDKEPYLQYAVRESTVFFLRDLVNEFFLKGNELQVADIKKQSWYFSDYNLDPSIISMLSALNIIEKKRNEINTEGFSEFIINNIKIQYYDVQDKKHREERFVIINTTGKSLTVSENIKPILLANLESLELSIQWEERETYFWKNRNKNENIADNGVNDFLTWCFQIRDKQEEIDIIKKAKQLLKEEKNKKFLEEINEVFISLKQLIEFCCEDKFQRQFKFINDNKTVESIIDFRNLNNEKRQNVLLPLIAFISKFENDKERIFQFLRRLRKNYFDLKWKDRNHNYIDWRYILKIIEKSNSIEQVLQFETNESAISKIQNISLNNWYNEEEKLKAKLSEHKNKIEEWEDYKDFMGDLTPLFDVVEDKASIEGLEKYFTVYSSIDIENFTYSDNIKLKNIHRLISYVENGRFEHRSVGGYGYCMLCKSNERQFLHKDFKSIWKQFTNHNIIENIQFFENKLKVFFIESVLRKNNEKITLDDLIDDTSKVGHYERVYLWAILEYLYTDKELKFDQNIAQFWEYPNLIVKNDANEHNDYSIGNLLLGASYYNNKSGWIDFTKYPLMNKLKEQNTVSEARVHKQKLLSII